MDIMLGSVDQPLFTLALLDRLMTGLPSDTLLVTPASEPTLDMSMVEVVAPFDEEPEPPPALPLGWTCETSGPGPSPHVASGTGYARGGEGALDTGIVASGDDTIGA